MQRIFDGADVAVDFDPAGGDLGTLTASFSNFDHNIATKPPARAFDRQLNRMNRPALYFVAKKNHWFHTPDMLEALAAARPIVSRFKIVQSTGSSMGAHAALRFAKGLGATVAVAVSAQYSVNPKIVGGFENRWSEYIDKIGSFMPDPAPDTLGCPAYVLYDSKHYMDSRQAQLLKAIPGVTLIELPYSGHSALSAICDVGLYRQLFLFTGSEPNDSQIAGKIIETYERDHHQAATVILRRIRKMCVEDREDFVSGLPDIIGMQRNKDSLLSFLAETKQP